MTMPVPIQTAIVAPFVRIGFALSLVLAAWPVFASPLVTMTISETGCTLSCTPVTVTDGGTGTISITSLTVGDYKLNNFYVYGLLNETTGDYNGYDATNMLFPTGSISRSSIGGAGVLSIAITETGIVAQDAGVITADFSASETLAKNSTLTVAGYLDTTDAPFGVGVGNVLTLVDNGANPGVTVTYPGGTKTGSVAYSNAATSQRSASADSGPLSIVMTSAGDFSVTELYTVQLGTNTTTTGLSDQMTADPPVYSPEPGTLAILGTGMAGLGLARARRRGKTS